MAVVEEAKAELKKRRQPFDKEIQIGIMVEIPSAAVVADLLAREVKFFSIGTNDLIQYALAIDRVNEHVAYLYRPLHPAVLRLVRETIRAAHNHDIPVGMCGEMAGEPMFALVLLGLGLDELSMNSTAIPVVKSVLRGTTLEQAKDPAAPTTTSTSWPARSTTASPPRRRTSSPSPSRSSASSASRS